MPTDSTNVSIAVLRAVLEGDTYDAIARAHGVTRTAIERRVKRLARLLQRRVGIRGLNSEATGYVQKLREAREEVEAAISRFERGECVPEVPPAVLNDKEVETLIRRAAMRSATPLRDKALIHVVLATGARPLEVARLEIADYLNPDGSVRSDSEMRASVSVNRKPRPLFFRSGAAVKAIDAYLEERRTGSGCLPRHETRYRGFEPADRLFLNDTGQPYFIKMVDTPGRTRHLCRQMLDTYRRIFARTNMYGVSALTLRRMVAVRLDARGADEEQIGLILGITERQAVRELLPRRPDMAELMTDLYADVGARASVARSQRDPGRMTG